MHFRFAKLASHAVLASAIVSLAAAATAAEPIKIGVTGPFTGGSSSMGVSMRDGVKLAVEEINKAGGVLGRPLQTVERDDEAKPNVVWLGRQHLGMKVTFVDCTGMHQVIDSCPSSC